MEKKLPLELRCLGTGQVIRFVSRNTTSPKEHWFLVLNASPVSDKALLLSIFTSNVARIRAMSPPETVVEIGPADFSGLSVPTCIDCNRLIEHPLESLIGEKIDYSPGTLPAPIVERVLAAIAQSDQVSAHHRKMLKLQV